ncbi:MAG: hypothetical protein ACJAS1_005897 [Oleiphilaceae bacterium]|jgi:hypothetical protein
MIRNTILKFSFSSLVLSSLVACGGGGGASGGASSDQLMDQYSGITKSAVLTENDIYPTFNYLFNGDFSTLSSVRQKQSVQINSAATRLRSAQTRVNVTTRAKESVPCNYGGELIVEENLNQDTGVGKISYTYNQCDQGDVVVSGRQIYDYSLWNSNFEPVDFNIIYENYLEQYNGSYFKLTGGLAVKGATSCKQTTTSNLLLETDKISVLEQDLKNEYLPCDTAYPEQNISGRVYFSNIGYVDITTTSPIILDDNQQLLSGNLHLYNEQSSIVLETVASNTTVSVDSNHDAIIDFSVTAPSWHFTEQPYSEVRDAKRILLIPDSGVALSKFVTVEKLSHSVDIFDSGGLTSTNWTATTTSSWLTVSPSGTTAEKLTISADPKGLAVDTLHTATITVSSSDVGIEHSQTINVGFWVGSSDPLASAAIRASYSNVSSDPVRPYIYLNAGESDIDVYNVYNQTLVTTITSVGASLAAMEVSADGKYLYVADTYDNSITIIDLDNTNNRSSWLSSEPLETGFTLSNTNGKELLISGYGNLYDAQTGYLYLSDTHTFNSYSGYNYLDASLFGNRFCAINSGDFACYDINYKRFSDKVLVSVLGIPMSVGANGKDVALNNEGTIAYAASGSPYEFVIVNIDTMSIRGSLSADAYPTAVEVGPDNALHGATSTSYGPTDIWIYESNGVLRTSDYISDYAEVINDRALAISGDGFISIAIINNDPFFDNGNAGVAFVSGF